jgi:hypothetical protein
MLLKGMHENMLSAAARLSDEALLASLERLALRERDATLEIVAHLTELDRRRVHLAEGPGSVYGYCRNVLGYSEDAAWNRAATAAAVRRYPIILGWLADGSLNITTVRILKSVLTPENHLAVLTEARHRGKKEVELIQKRLDPKPDVPSTIRKVAAAPSVVAPPLLELNDAATPSLTARAAPPAVPGLSPSPTRTAPAPRPVVGPLTPDRYRVQFTVSKATYDKLRHVQDLLCREVPDGDPATIFDRALDLLVNDVEKKKLAATKSPRPPRRARDGSRDVPAHVQRTVWERDGGQCAFEGKRGRCTERRFLEWHHVQPFGHQGPATVENISLRCRAHNLYESELVFGRFEPSVVRERAEIYATSRESRAVPERRAMPSACG